MNRSFRMAVCVVGLLWVAGSAQAQTMPQDNWRYDNVTFAGPDTNLYKRSIAIGLGGVYVGQGNPATNIVQFNENGGFVRKFAALGWILGMACDSAGNLYVLNRTDAKVKVFDKDGIALREWGGPGSADGQFSLASWDGATFLAVDGSNQVYVCDPGNSRVQVFNDQGSFLRKWGTVGVLPGQFGSGQPLAIAVGKNGWVYLGSTTTTPPLLQIFDTQGAFIKSLNNIGAVNSVAVTADGVFATYDNRSYGTVRFFDLSLADLNSSIPATVQGIAFNTRGDLYRVTGNTVEIYEREYSSVQNPLSPPGIPQPLVMAVAQRAGTSYLDVDYRVMDADSPTVQAAALAFINGGNTLAEVVPISTLLEGTAANIGTNQPVNTTRRITWDMAADWSVDFAQIKVEVLAKDNRNLLGVHWITVPAEGNNPAIQISRKPVSDAEMLSLWYWFIASHHPGVTLTSGKVYGNAGLLSGKELASGTATRSYGRLFAYEQMGIRAITQSEIARAQAGSYGFTSVDANSVVRDAYVTTETGIVGWGYDGNGEISGAGLHAFGAYTALAAGSNHGLALSSNGTVVAWGHNGQGQCNVPAGLTNVTAIAAGQYHSLALKSDGTVVAWEYNAQGQCNVPPGLTNATAIAAGRLHSLALKSDGTVVAWGYNGQGQCNVPASLASVTAIAAGYYHSLALKSDGTVAAWQYNGHGECNVPAGLTNVTAIAAGDNHSLALKSNGTVVAWGYSAQGQTTVPAGLTNVTTIAAGGDFSLALKKLGN